MRRRFSALLFHHVGPRRPLTYASLTIEPVRFERFMRLLARTGHSGVSAADWLSWRRGERSLPRRAVILTFDDAYEDLVEFALPTLVRFGFRATAFVVASEVGGRNSWDVPAGAGGHTLMSATDVRTWLDAGMDVGAHGLTHADLASLPPEQVKEEILGSHAALSELCGRAPSSFAYPFGTQVPQAAEVVATAFPIAFGVRGGRNGADTDPVALRRTLVEASDTWLDILLRAELGWSPLSRLRSRLRIRSRARRLLGHAGPL